MFYHRFKNELEVGSHDIITLPNDEYVNWCKENNQSDVFLEKNRLTNINVGNELKNPEICLYIPVTNNDKAFIYAHQILKHLNVQCFVSKELLSDKKKILETHNDCIFPKSSTNLKRITKKIIVSPNTPIKTRYLEQTLFYEDTEIWSPCSYAENPEEDLPDVEDHYLDNLCVLLMIIIGEKAIDPDVRFEAAIYQYLIASEEKFFDCKSGEDSLFCNDIYFQRILSLAHSIYDQRHQELYNPNPDIIVDLWENNENCLKRFAIEYFTETFEKKKL